MRRPAAVLAPLALLLVLAACAPEAPVPSPSPTQSEQAVVEPSPTPSARVVGAAEKPPAVFGGDCAAVMTPSQVSAAVGLEMVQDETPPFEGFTPVENAGAISCHWSWEDGDRYAYLEVGVFPAAGLEGVDVGAVQSHWIEPDCEWYCAVVDEIGGLTVVTSMSEPTKRDGESPHQALSRIGDAIAPQVAANHEALDEPLWVRDRAAWEGVPDCAALAPAAGSALGFAVEARGWSTYVDVPLHTWLVAEDASEQWACALRTASGAEAEMNGYAGAGWGQEPEGASRAEVEGLPEGWSGYVFETDPSGTYSHSGMGFATDGVNTLQMAVSPEAFGADAPDVLKAAVTAFIDQS